MKLDLSFWCPRVVHGQHVTRSIYMSVTSSCPHLGIQDAVGFWLVKNMATAKKQVITVIRKPVKHRVINTTCFGSINSTRQEMIFYIRKISISGHVKLDILDYNVRWPLENWFVDKYVLIWSRYLDTLVYVSSSMIYF